MSDRLAIFLTFLFGAWGIVAAGLIKFGILKEWPKRYYAAESAPLYVRNGVFGLLPLSSGMLLAGVAVVVPNIAGLPFFAGALALALWVVAIRWIRRPPEWLKPDWMKTAERQGDTARSSMRWIELSPVQYWATWVALLTVLGLALVLHWPASVLIGTGIGIIFVSASRPVRSDDRR